MSASLHALRSVTGESRGQPHTLFLRSCLSRFVLLRQGLLFPWGRLNWLGWLASEPKGSSGLSASSAWMTSTCHQTWCLHVGSGNWTWAPQLATQVLHQLSLGPEDAAFSSSPFSQFSFPQPVLALYDWQRQVISPIPALWVARRVGNRDFPQGTFSKTSPNYSVSARAVSSPFSSLWAKVKSWP